MSPRLRAAMMPTPRVHPPYLSKIRHLLLFGRRLTAGTWLDILARVYGDRVCIHVPGAGVFSAAGGGRAVSYRTLLALVNRLGRALLQSGLGRGDRIIVMTSNRVELALACFAAMKIGAIPVPLNFQCTRREVRDIMGRCAPKALLCDREVWEGTLGGAGSCPDIPLRIVMSGGASPGAGAMSLEELMSAQPPDLDPADVDPDAVAIILYTSGTCGTPKGAMITGRGLSRFIRVVAAAGAVLPSARTHVGVYALPLAHIMGYLLLLAHLCAGVPVVFLPKFDPLRVLTAIRAHRATIFIAVPAMYTVLLHAIHSRPGRFDLSSMRVWGCAADVLSPGIVRDLRALGGWRLLGVRIPPLVAECYGQVETLGMTAIRIHGAGEAPGCIGRPLPDLDIRVVDPARGDVPAGAVGELWVRGPRVMKGYWNDDARTAESFSDGWFRTGDLVRRDRWGRLYFMDREKDMIKVCGYSVFPGEIEGVLRSHPDVEEAAVVGIPDAAKGQVPVAAVVLKHGSAAQPRDILEWTRRAVAGYKCPRVVEVVSALPTGPTRKVSKKDLRERMMGAAHQAG